MKMYSYGVGLLVALVCVTCLTESTIAQGFSRTFQSSSGRASGNANGGQGDNSYGNDFPANGATFQQQGHSSVSANRSVSFRKNGKRVSITENSSGITVTIDGQSVRARDVEELKKYFPDAYRLYADNIGAAQASGLARGSAGGSAGSTSGNQPGNRQVRNSSSKNRSISLIDNGRKVSIAENRTGITVSVNGKIIRARNATELKKRNVDAYNLYEEHLAPPKARQEAPNATDLLREELNKMRDENANNPALRGLIEKMLQEVNK